MFRLTRPKFVFCDSVSIKEVRKALRSLSMDTATKLVTVDQKVDDVDTVAELLQQHDDEDRFV